LDLGLESVCIFEDDAILCDNFIEELNLVMNELPDDWDGLHLAGYSQPSSLKNFSARLYKAYATWGGYGYIVNKRVIPKLIETIKQEKTQVDTYYARLMPQLNWYKSKLMLVKHPPNFSTIQQKWVDYKNLY